MESSKQVPGQEGRIHDGLGEGSGVSWGAKPLPHANSAITAEKFVEEPPPTWKAGMGEWGEGLREELVGPDDRKCGLTEQMTRENHVWWPREKKQLIHSFIHSL